MLSAGEIATKVKKKNAHLIICKTKPTVIPKTDVNLYPIQNKKSGFYHLFEFTAPGEAIGPYEQEFKRDERIMRFLTVKLDKHAIEWAEKRRNKLKAKA